MERDLFTETASIEDLAAHIERKAMDLCDGFNVSFGIWKPQSKNATIEHEVLIVCTLKGGQRLKPTKIQATSIRHMFSEVDQFFNSIKLTPMSEITEAKVRAVVKSALNLAEAPMNKTMHELGCSNADLVKIQQRFARAFNKSVSTVFFSDTIFSLTEKLTK